MLTGDKCFVLKHDVKFLKTIIANRLNELNESNSQPIFCTHKRHMFIANLNDNDDSPIGKYAGISFEPVWRN